MAYGPYRPEAPSIRSREIRRGGCTWPSSRPTHTACRTGSIWRPRCRGCGAVLTATCSAGPPKRCHSRTRSSTRCVISGVVRLPRIFPLDPMAVDAGAPAHWSTCIAVNDLEEALRYVEKGGGTPFGPTNESTLGRRAAIQDSVGAFFALWQAGSLAGSAFANEPGAFTWNELQTNDVVRAADFYQDVLGWDVDATPMPTGNVYHVFRREGHELAGMMEIDPEWGPVPPNWSVYFASMIATGRRLQPEIWAAVSRSPRCRSARPAASRCSRIRRARTSGCRRGCDVEGFD